MKAKKVSPANFFNSRLAAYSAAATAALLIAPTVADATIYNFTRFYDVHGDFETTPPDFNGSPLNASHSDRFTAATANDHRRFVATFQIARWTTYNKHFGRIKMRSIYSAGNNSAGKMAYGNLISGKDFNFIYTGFQFLASRRLFATLSGGGTHEGRFLPAGEGAHVTGYIGFKESGFSFKEGVFYYYGWLRIKVINDGEDLPFEVTFADKDGDGIYGAFGLAGDSIKAGEVAPVPEPSVAAIGGLGLLALGASGVRELRRRKAGIKN